MNAKTSAYSPPSLPLPPVGQRPVTPLNPDRAYLLEFARIQKSFVKGEGCWLTDEAGAHYLDFNAQYGALPFGHNPEDLWKILLQCQSELLPALVQPAVAPAARELATRLLALAPGKIQHVTFCSTGAEAVEAAIKLARSKTGRPNILSLERGYHGKTLAALSATGRAEYQKPFFAPLPGFQSIPFGDLSALELYLDAHGKETAAFFAEVVQGEGGMRPLPEGFLKEAARLCRKHGVLLALDEVQTGLGRTGLMFACEAEEVQPDMILLSKALGGGLFPLGAMLCTAEAWSQSFGMLHSSTFANHALACRVALGVLDRLISPGFLAHVQAASAYLRQGLAQLHLDFPELIQQITGRGLMLAIHINTSIFMGDDSLILSALVQEGTLAPFLCGHLINVHKLWLAPFLSMGNALRLEPPLTISLVEIDRAVQALHQCFQALQSRDVGALLRYQLGDFSPPQNTRIFTPLNPRPKATKIEVHDNVRRFAFFAHYTDLDDIRRSEPSFGEWSDSMLQEWTRRTASHSRPLPTYRIPLFRSLAGTPAEGWLITLGLLPEQLLYMGQRRGSALLQEGVEIAKSLGAIRLGLGAFTSVITAGGQSLTGKGIPITSGNTYTVMVAISAVQEACKRLGLSLAQARIAVIGAAGSVGRLAALLLAEEAQSLLLVGNRENVDRVSQMRRVMGEIYRLAWSKPEAGIGATLSAQMPALVLTQAWPAVRHALAQPQNEETDEALATAIEEAYSQASLQSPPLLPIFDTHAILPDCDVVVCATSSTGSVVDPMLLKSGAIVCDVALPPDLALDARKLRPDVLVFDGGLARYPSQDLCAGFNFGFPPGVGPGCFSETMLLALEGDMSDRSIGRRLNLEDVDFLKKAAIRHGFTSGGVRSRSKLLSEADFQAIKTAASRLESKTRQESSKNASPPAFKAGRRRAPLTQPGERP